MTVFSELHVVSIVIPWQMFAMILSFIALVTDLQNVIFQDDIP